MTDHYLYIFFTSKITRETVTHRACWELEAEWHISTNLRKFTWKEKTEMRPNREIRSIWGGLNKMIRKTFFFYFLFLFQWPKEATITRKGCVKNDLVEEKYVMEPSNKNTSKLEFKSDHIVFLDLQVETEEMETSFASPCGEKRLRLNWM